jgi:chaperonin cofactor prefoldin
LQQLNSAIGAVNAETAEIDSLQTKLTLLSDQMAQKEASAQKAFQDAVATSAAEKQRLQTEIEALLAKVQAIEQQAELTVQQRDGLNHQLEEVR